MHISGLYLDGLLSCGFSKYGYFEQNRRGWVPTVPHTVVVAKELRIHQLLLASTSIRLCFMPVGTSKDGAQ